TIHTYSVILSVFIKHNEFIHLHAAWANGARNKTPRFAISHYAASPKPLWRNSAAIVGSRPRKLINNSMGALLPPCCKISRKKLSPVCALKMPSSSKREKASADRTSAHL